MGETVQDEGAGEVSGRLTPDLDSNRYSSIARYRPFITTQKAAKARSCRATGGASRLQACQKAGPLLTLGGATDGRRRLSGRTVYEGRCMVIGALVTPVILPPAEACSTPTGMARSRATNPSARLPSTISPTPVCHISGHCVTICAWPCSPPSPPAARANGERGPGRAVPADSRAWARCVPAPGRQTITARSHRVLGGRVGGVVRHGRFLTSFTSWAWRHCRRTRWGPWTSRSAGAARWSCRCFRRRRAAARR